MAEALTVALVAAIAWGCWREWSVRRLRGRVAMAVRELSETRRLQFKSNEEAMALVKTCWEMQIDGMRRTNDAWMQLFAAKKLIHRLGRMVEAGRRRLRLSRRACRNLNRACDEADARWHRDVGRLTADRDEWKAKAEAKVAAHKPDVDREELAKRMHEGQGMVRGWDNCAPVYQETMLDYADAAIEYLLPRVGAMVATPDVTDEEVAKVAREAERAEMNNGKDGPYSSWEELPVKVKQAKVAGAKAARRMLGKEGE